MFFLDPNTYKKKILSSLEKKKNTCNDVLLVQEKALLLVQDLCLAQEGHVLALQHTEKTLMGTNRQ